MRTVVGLALAFAATVSAVPAAHAEDGSRIVSARSTGVQEESLVVYAASMKREVPLTVLLPKDTAKPRPVLYLLNGVGGGERVKTADGTKGSSWGDYTTYRKFFRDKNVYVVTPMSGRFSYYTDWREPDPQLGIQKWQTFLTEELPPLIDQHYGTARRNAIAGLSMGGTSVFNLAIANHRLYRSVAAFSGCARTSDPIGQQYVKLTINDNARNRRAEKMWGPVGGPGWLANDPYVQAPRLRGIKIYMTTGSGLPGENDTLERQDVKNGGPHWLADQILSGGVIEAAVNLCTQQMAQRLSSIGIPYRLTVRPTGTHAWSYWQQDLYNTWPALARDLATS
ncbi:alpha/beta hydrolase family protein [Gordonia sp. X0973]|uniref:alpha/beta hydrolase n=1 Tax=Gordonia sp. X0973 TaxID=2742602 RepID=UPI002657365E|nr:alpha/beta hydrolase family protein [Gordonia sp. X0973]